VGTVPNGRSYSISVNAVLLGFDRDEDIVAGRLERATW
jgi:hypothetical protein